MNIPTQWSVFLDGAKGGIQFLVRKSQCNAQVEQKGFCSNSHGLEQQIVHDANSNRPSAWCH